MTRETLSPRGRETRANQSRGFEEREIVDMLESSPLHVSEHEIPDGMDYAWVRETVVGEIQHCSA